MRTNVLCCALIFCGATYVLLKRQSASGSRGLTDDNAIYALTGEIADALDGAGIAHSLYSGSLLGAWRHGGVIPFADKDVDLAVFETNTTKLERILDELGVAWHLTDFGFHIMGRTLVPEWVPRYGAYGWVREAAGGGTGTDYYVDLWLHASVGGKSWCVGAGDKGRVRLPPTHRDYGKAERDASGRNTGFRRYDCWKWMAETNTHQAVWPDAMIKPARKVLFGRRKHWAPLTYQQADQKFGAGGTWLDVCGCGALKRGWAKDSACRFYSGTGPQPGGLTTVGMPCADASLDGYVFLKDCEHGGLGAEKVLGAASSALIVPRLTAGARKGNAGRCRPKVLPLPEGTCPGNRYLPSCVPVSDCQKLKERCPPIMPSLTPPTGSQRTSS